MAIYEKELDYAVGLANYLNRQAEFPFQVCLFTSPESLEHYAGQHDVDIFLLGENCEYRTDRNQTLRLVGHGRGRGADAIYKYQSARNIMREVSDYCQMNGLVQSDTEGSPQMIHTIFSPGSGLERTQYAKQLSKQLMQEGKVLYLNLDLFPGREDTISEEERGLSEFIYYLKQNGEGLEMQFQSLLKRSGGFCTIPPVHCSMDLQALTDADAQHFFQLLRREQEFYNIVLDVGFYNDCILTFCKMSDRLYLVESENGMDSAEFFIAQIGLMQNEGIEKKFKRVGGTLWNSGKG